jgi:hypothetical protein
VTNVVRYATTTKQTNARYAAGFGEENRRRSVIKRGRVVGWVQGQRHSLASGEDGCKDARKSLAAVSVWDARYNGAVLSVLALWAGL